MFPCEHYGLAGKNERKPHAKTIDPNIPRGRAQKRVGIGKEARGSNAGFTILDPGLHPPARTWRVLPRRGLHHGLERQHDRQMGRA